MATVRYGDVSQFDAALYGMPHAGTLNFLQNQFSSLTGALTDASKEFYRRAEELYETYSGEDALRSLRAAIRTVGHAWDADIIRPLYDIGDFQQARYKMQRWVMAEPELRKLYQQQRVDGYTDEYIDIYPDAIGDSHYDFRRVMQGVVTFDEEPDQNGEYGWMSTTYFDDLVEDDCELTLNEQVDILTAWEHLKYHITKRKEDPTSRFNGEIG